LNKSRTRKAMRAMNGRKGTGENRKKNKKGIKKGKKEERKERNKSSPNNEK